MCNFAEPSPIDSIREKVLTMRIPLDINNVETCQLQRQVEKDSGIYSSMNEACVRGKFQEPFEHIGNNYSKSRRSSACSSGFSSVCSSIPTIPSPDIMPSSAYSSATSSCCDSEAPSRRKSDIVRPTQCLYSANDKNVDYSKSPFGPNIVPYSKSVLNLASDIKINSIAVHSATRYNAKGRARSIGCSKTQNSQPRLRNAKSDTIYEKRRLLGKGGFARVYEVAELDQTGKMLKRSYAAKIIDRSRLARSQQREKVEVEVELLTEARGHPHVVHFVDSFEEDNAVCILLELCNKRSLAQFLRKKRYQSLNEPEVCNIMQQIVSGLSHLHGKGIIHRDLKLGNILLTDDMQVKIGDFGLATRVEWGKKRTICGTPNFIAPEVLQRQGHGPESDIWAVGCLLYNLLVGKPPFENYCLKETYRCILKNNYHIPSTVSPEARDLIRWMLNHKPKSRPELFEISSHAFFLKHSSYLSSLRSTSSKQMTSSNKSTRKIHSYLSSLSSKLEVVETNNSANVIEPSQANTSSDDKSHTLLGSNSNDGSLTPNPDVQPSLQMKISTALKEPKALSSPVKLIASRLHKKLTKVSSPGKYVRAAASALCDRRKGAESVKKDDSLKGNTDFDQTCEPYSVSAGPITWISKWVDYSNRYGFGYQLVNGRICVLFNDGKHISMHPNEKVMEYASGETSTAVRFTKKTIPSCLCKYTTMFETFSYYMDKNLHQNNETPESQSGEECARLLNWCRTEEYIAMYLSNGTLQVNFCKDHFKININSLHQKSTMKITVMDERQNSTTYDIVSFLKITKPDIQKRLETIHELFHNMFVDISCNTHPFCGICVKSGCLKVN